MTPGELMDAMESLIGFAEPECADPLRAALQALADVRTLDTWSTEETYRHVFLYGWGAGGMPRVVLHSNNASINEEVFRAATLDEARQKAAAWVRGLK